MKLWEHPIDIILEERIGIREAKRNIKEKSTRPTSINLSQTIRMEADKLSRKYGVPIKWVLERLVVHGLSNIQSTYKDDIKEIDDLFVKIEDANMRVVRNYLYDQLTTINGLNKPKKVQLVLQEEIFGAISKIGRLLRIEQSSVIRVCMYLALSTLRDGHPETLDAALRKENEFKERVKEIKITYRGFKKMEEEYLEEK